MPQTSLPVLGAALKIAGLTQHRDWLLDKQRDVELQDFHSAADLSGDWRGMAERTSRLLDGHTGRRGIHGPFWGFKLDSHDPDIRDVVSRRLMQALDACAVLGADQMVIHSPFTAWDHNNLDNDRTGLADLTERTHRTLRPVVSRAEQQGVTLVVENIEDRDPRARVALAASFNSDAVRVSVDTGHAHYAHGSLGAPPVDYYIRAAGEALRHIHLQDADGFADRHWPPGQGTIRWAPVFAAIGALSSNPRLILELRDHTLVRAGAAHLEALGLAQ
ncbi:sugar phosphate isomerase/epimerase family protein [Roseomonas haemaphysalidis]|uniref:Sugar phosphate isomerase/epimerase n=1 Tax=Roseomonas haemaphysalidis TaxID=2768162 RepID=A0ABS3KP74_9PROT|nr:sugar phosphate isomerase/epimerase family protein [Roseomonas haemaphysalidis]MBO1079245.1 sugar phosphate isomerase/epimerase [Roseomonas haemaphysalidis]